MKELPHEIAWHMTWHLGIKSSMYEHKSSTSNVGNVPLPTDNHLNIHLL